MERQSNHFRRWELPHTFNYILTQEERQRETKKKIASQNQIQVDYELFSEGSHQSWSLSHNTSQYMESYNILLQNTGSSNLRYNLINLQQQQSKHQKMASFVNNCSSSFAGFFVPMSHSDYSFLQLHQILPLSLSRNEEMFNNRRSALQYSDGKGKWTFDQQKQYILFLHQNMEEMRQKSSRKSKKVFLKMSMKVKTRTPDQCRSHHQKILKYHQSLELIIRHYTQVVYSFEKIFGFESSKGKKSIETLKTGLDQEISEDHRLWVEGNKVKILINSDFIIDY